MAKFYGVIGYASTDVEESPGIYIAKIIEKKHYGDLLRVSKRNQQSSEYVNDSLVLNHQISIMSDPYASEHFAEMQYVKCLVPNIGGVWRITDVTVEYPRIILTIGGVYNGEQANAAE